MGFTRWRSLVGQDDVFGIRAGLHVRDAVEGVQALHGCVVQDSVRVSIYGWPKHKKDKYMDVQTMQSPLGVCLFLYYHPLGMLVVFVFAACNSYNETYNKS